MRFLRPGVLGRQRARHAAVPRAEPTKTSTARTDARRRVGLDATAMHEQAAVVHRTLDVGGRAVQAGTRHTCSAARAAVVSMSAAGTPAGGDDFARKYGHGRWSRALHAGSGEREEIVARGMRLLIDVLGAELEALAARLRGGPTGAGDQNAADRSSSEPHATDTAPAADRDRMPAARRATGAEVDALITDLSRDDAAERVMEGVGAREVRACSSTVRRTSQQHFHRQKPGEPHTRCGSQRPHHCCSHTRSLKDPRAKARRCRPGVVDGGVARHRLGGDVSGDESVRDDPGGKLVVGLKGDGVDVTAVLPGATDTEGLRRNSPYIEDPASLARPRRRGRSARASRKNAVVHLR